MRPLIFSLALLMIAPMATKTIIPNKQLPSRSIASLEEIQKDLQGTIKEKLKNKIVERDEAKADVARNEKDENCKDELLASQTRLQKLETEVKELQDLKLSTMDGNLVICDQAIKPSILSKAITDLIAQQQYTLMMYNQMQNLLLGYQLQNIYFELLKPSFSDLGQHQLSLNSIISMGTFSPWSEPTRPLPTAESYNFGSPEDQAADAYNRMVPDVSRNPLYSPNWGGFSLVRGQMPDNQGFDFGTPSSDVSQNAMYQPSMNGFSDSMINEVPTNTFNFN